MKKTYTKPMVTFEELALDMPIAANCDPGYIDIMKDLKTAGVFSVTCNDYWTPDQLDTLCYFAAVSNPLIS